MTTKTDHTSMTDIIDDGFGDNNTGAGASGTLSVGDKGYKRLGYGEESGFDNSQSVDAIIGSIVRGTDVAAGAMPELPTQKTATTDTVMGQAPRETSVYDEGVDLEALEKMEKLLAAQRAGTNLHKTVLTDAYYHIKDIHGLNHFIESVPDSASDHIHTIAIDPSNTELLQHFIDFLYKRRNVFGLVGYSPRSIHNHKIPDTKLLAELIKTTPKIIGVGYVGLDYHYNRSNKEEQKQLLREQLQLAVELEKPVFIGSIHADKDLYTMLNEFRNQNIKLDPVYVYYVQTLDVFQMILDHSCHVVVRPEVTYPENDLYRECLKEIAKERLLIGSGNEVSAPLKHRGQWNKSEYISETLETLAAELDEDHKTLSRRISMNFNELFNSNPEAGDDVFYFQPSVDNETLIMTEGTLLENDVDADGDTLYIKEIFDERLVGHVYFDRELRIVVYTPKPDFIGADKFDYVVTDGRGGSDRATVTIHVASRRGEAQPDSKPAAV